MKIEPVSPHSQIHLSTVKGFHITPHAKYDSIETLQCSSWTWIKAKVRRFYRYIEGVVRRILFRFFPVRTYARIQIRQIDYLRIPGDERSSYRILIDGVSTNNEVLYTVRNGVVFLSDIQFADKALREHLGSILGHILADEKATAFSTNLFDMAKVLWQCGCDLGGATIRYYPNNNDSSNQGILRTLIESAQGRHADGNLPASYHESLQRIEGQINRRPGPIARAVDTVVDGFVMLGESLNLVEQREEEVRVDIQLSDVLHLMDGLQIDRLRGITFQSSARHWVRFTMRD